MIAEAYLSVGERVVAELWCLSCGYGAVAFCSAGWVGRTPPIPEHCPECGAFLLCRDAASGKEVAS